MTAANVLHHDLASASLGNQRKGMPVDELKGYLVELVSASHPLFIADTPENHPLLNHYRDQGLPMTYFVSRAEPSLADTALPLPGDIGEQIEAWRSACQIARRIAEAERNISEMAYWDYQLCALDRLDERVRASTSPAISHSDAG